MENPTNDVNELAFQFLEQAENAGVPPILAASALITAGGTLFGALSGPLADGPAKMGASAGIALFIATFVNARSGAGAGNFGINEDETGASLGTLAREAVDLIPEVAERGAALKAQQVG